jgi:phosphoribosyl-ATP pyrophosphohydrolase/phosphoribosyl-AMP cyclohydrolase
MNKAQLSSIDWQKMKGLIPAIIQDRRNGEVLMLGYMNQEALAITLETKQLTFFSRSKQDLWQKGQTSGNTMLVEAVSMDCDGDSLLVQVTPNGPACHLGSTSCFKSALSTKLTFLYNLVKLIRARDKERPPGSYTSQLFDSGIHRCAQKVGEEAVETIIAATSNSDQVVYEAADLFFHLLVLLQACKLSFDDVLDCLQKRHTKEV